MKIFATLILCIMLTGCQWFNKGVEQVNTAVRMADMPSYDWVTDYSPFSKVLLAGFSTSLQPGQFELLTQLILALDKQAETQETVNPVPIIISFATPILLSKTAPEMTPAQALAALAVLEKAKNQYASGILQQSDVLEALYPILKARLMAVIEGAK